MGNLFRNRINTAEKFHEVEERERQREREGGKAGKRGRGRDYHLRPCFKLKSEIFLKYFVFILFFQPK